MIYVSSSCVRADKIADAVRTLAEAGYRRIELSGGTRYYSGYERDLLELQSEYGLKFLLHNYFPPPQEDLILNLASLDEDIWTRTLEHYTRALELSALLGARRFGLHAGLFIDFSLSEIGRDVSPGRLVDESQATDRFCAGFERIKRLAGDIELYIENNVLSAANGQTFQGRIPFLLVDHAGYLALRKRIEFKLLLDLAHLKVCARTLRHDLVQEMNLMIPLADYIHISDNDGTCDSNQPLTEQAGLAECLQGQILQGKTFTLEVYGTAEDLRRSYEILRGITGAAE